MKEGEKVPADIQTETVNGVLRYKRKPLMRYLADNVDLNKLSIAHQRGEFSTEEYMQFYRDMGYSLAGFEEIFGVYEGPEDRQT